MKDLFQRLAGGGSDAGTPRLTLAALGKHPGWDDHLPGIGIDTDALVQVKQVLYGEGIRRQVDSGAWEALEADRRCEGFDHSFVWLRPAHVVLGLLWSSTDGKGRAKYPMVLCVDGQGIPPAFIVDQVLPGLERLREACKAARTSAQVTSDCAAAQTQLRALESVPQAETGPVPPLAVRQAFLQRPEFAPDRAGLLRVLHELGHTSAGPAGGRGQAPDAHADLHPHHIRVPLVSESPGAAILLWSAFFRSALPDAVPILLMVRAGGEWLDVIIGEPAADDFFCLQASPKALPMATEIPYDLAPDLAVRLQEVEARFLGAPLPKASAPPPPPPVTAPRPPSLPPAPASAPAIAPRPPASRAPAPPPPSVPPASKPSGRKGWFWLSGAVLVLAGVAAFWFFNSSKPNPTVPASPSVLADEQSKPPTTVATTPAVPAKPAGPKEQDLKFEAALKQGQAALAQGDFSTALAQAAIAIGVRSNDEAALKLAADAQVQKEAAKTAAMKEQSYQTALRDGNAALARKDYAGAIASAEAALGIKKDDPAAIKLRADAQKQQADDMAAARATDEKYQAAIIAAQTALDKKDFAEAIKQCDFALQARSGDGAALKLKQLAQQRQAEVATSPTTSTPPVVSAAVPAAPGGERKALTNTLGMEFVWFPNISGGGGYLGKCEVTQKQYNSVAGRLPKTQVAVGDDLPVINVSAEEARDFCTRLSKAEGKTYALPSKEDWLAAAGLSAQEISEAWKIVGDKGLLDNEITSLKTPLSQPARVGSRGEQANGICDLFGNVREWLAGGESAGFSFASSAGRTKSLFLGANEVQWVQSATGFRCLLRP
jgi:formylglycine-generating enzyme required for sulfatase activity